MGRGARAVFVAKARDAQAAAGFTVALAAGLVCSAAFWHPAITGVVTSIVGVGRIGVDDVAIDPDATVGGVAGARDVRDVAVLAFSTILEEARDGGDGERDDDERAH
jgi:hypothetical protein